MITDVRFYHEIELLKKIGAKFILIIRVGLNNKDSHMSENELNDFRDYDYLIINDGTIEELYDKIDNIIMHSDLNVGIEY